jgi:hypothetical protein
VGDAFLEIGVVGFGPRPGFAGAGVPNYGEKAEGAAQAAQMQAILYRH